MTSTSPIIALNRSIAVAELDGPEVALATVDRLGDKLAGYHAYHATRADLLRRLAGFVINKFRGDADLPWSPDLWVDAEAFGVPRPVIGSQPVVAG